MKQVANNKNKQILCVIVSDFVGLDNIGKYLKTNGILTQETVLKLNTYQYLPYGKIENSITKNIEEKIIPLKRYPYIEKAYAQITKKILEFLERI